MANKFRRHRVQPARGVAPPDHPGAFWSPRPRHARFGGRQRWVVGLVTGGGSQLPLPWSCGAGAGCCCAAAGAAPATTAVIVSTNPSFIMGISFAASGAAAKETSPGEMRFLLRSPACPGMGAPPASRAADRHGAEAAAQFQRREFHRRPSLDCRESQIKLLSTLLAISQLAFCRYKNGGPWFDVYYSPASRDCPLPFQLRAKLLDFSPKLVTRHLSADG